MCITASYLLFPFCRIILQGILFLNINFSRERAPFLRRSETDERCGHPASWTSTARAPAPQTGDVSALWVDVGPLRAWNAGALCESSLPLALLESAPQDGGADDRVLMEYPR